MNKRKKLVLIVNILQNIQFRCAKKAKALMTKKLPKHYFL